MFREEAEMLEERLWGRTGTKNRYQMADSSPEKATGQVAEPVEETAEMQAVLLERSGAGVEPTQSWVTRPHRF
jgi:hypothetical protein